MYIVAGYDTIEWQAVQQESVVILIHENRSCPVEYHREIVCTE